MSVYTKDMIALQEWWIGEVNALTQKVITTEEKRQAKMSANAAKQLGEYRTYNDIQEAYGVGVITERKRDKLMDLLEEANPEEDRLYRMKLELLQEVVAIANRVIEDQKFGEVEL